MTPTSWDFGPVATTGAASKAFSLSGSNLTAGDLTISVPSGYSVSPNSLSVSTGTLDATEFTVTKNTNTAGVYDGSFTIYGGGVAQANAATATLSMTVVAPVDPTITFNNKTIEVDENLDLRTLFTSNSEGAVTYSITEGDSYATLGGDGYTLTGDAVGEVTIQASQAANAGYNAKSVTTTINVVAALPKITIDGSATGITTDDEAQNITVGVGSFGGTFKQYSTTGLWLTSGTGYIYNKASFGKIRKITINYKSGGSGTSYQWIKMGNTVMNSYEAASTNGIKYETSTGGSYNTFEVTGDYEYFCLSVSNKNLQATSIVITYETIPDGPAVSVDPASWDFEEVEASKSASKVFSVSGSDLETGTLTITAPEGYSVEPASIAVTSATLDATNITVSKNTTTQGTYNDNLVITGCGLASEKTVPLTMTVIADPDPAELPFAFDGGRADIASTTGMTQNDLESDYSESPKLKFKNQGTWVVINFNEDPGKLTYDIKGNSLDGTYAFTVEESTDGETYTNITTHTSISGSVEGQEFDLDKDSRYVRFVYTTKDVGNVGLGNIAISKYSAPPAVEAPTISGENNFFANTTVTISIPDGTTVYYTTDGSDPKSGSEYSEPFTLDETATVKAIAKKDDDYSDVAEMAFTKATVLTVAQAIAQIDAGTDLNDRYVTGIVSQVDEISTEHGNATYWISDDGTSAAFEVYRGKDFSKTNFTAATDIIVGDVVVVKGQLYYYTDQSIYEVKNTPEIIERTKRVVSLALSNDGTPYPVEFTEGDAFSHAHMVVTATYNSTHFTPEAVQENPACTWSGYDANTLGEQEITVSYGGQSVNYNVTVLGSCTNSAVIEKGVESNGTYSLSVSGTQCLDELPGNVTSTVLTAIPATHYHVASVTSLADDGVTPVGIVTETGENEYTISGIGANTTITAIFEADALSPWATVYTSNVTLSETGGTNASKATVDGKDALKAGTSSNAGAVQITVPQGTTELHYHAYGWTGKDVTLSITGPDGVTITPSSQALTSNSGMTGNSPFTLASGSHPEYDAYHSLTLSGVPNTGATLTFTSDEFRFVIWGVNAVYPAEITLDPTSHAFGEVKEGLTKSQEFTIAANAMCTGDLAAEIIGTDADKFEVSAIAANKVTVTFAPEVGEIGDFTAQLRVSCTNANVTANLTATGISATQPEISVDKTLVEFGSVPQGNPLASQAVAVTLSNISTGATASISGTAFSIDPENLAASGDITITPNTSLVPGNYSGTLTISATGATPKEVTVTMTIQDKWIVTYTSNVVLSTTGGTSASNATVVINENSYEAIKAGTSGTAGAVKIIVPAHTTKLHFHAAAWNNETVKLQIDDDTDNLIAIGSDAGVSNNSPFTLGSDAQYYSIDVVDISQPTEITISANTGKRFVIYGVNVDTYKRDVKVGNYGTLCVKNGGVLSGATLFEIAGKDAEKIYFDEVEGGIMEAGKPYIFLPEETSGETTTITVTYNTTNKTTAGYGNGFYGTYVEIKPVPKDEGNYVISNNRYILVDDDRVTLPAHRAYIKKAEIGSPSAPSGARRRVAISGAPAVVTDIDALNSDEAPRKVMIDGQLYIILGEKMFDATGRLVK